MISLEMLFYFDEVVGNANDEHNNLEPWSHNRKHGWIEGECGLEMLQRYKHYMPFLFELHHETKVDKFKCVQRTEMCVPCRLAH